MCFCASASYRIRKLEAQGGNKMEIKGEDVRVHEQNKRPGKVEVEAQVGMVNESVTEKKSIKSQR